MTTRTDADLERLLRSTFDTQATTVSTGPAWTGVPDHGPHRRWIAPLVAAALVVALVGAYLAVHSQRTAPPASPRGDFTSFEVAGYPVTSRLTAPDERSVIVRTPHGPRYGDVIVTVWARGTYRPGAVQDRRPVRISGHRGFAGSTGSEIYRNHERLTHQVAWEFAPHRWAVAGQMGNLRRLPTVAQLLAVARAARPDVELAQTTPFRLTALPPGFAFDHVEVKPSAGVLLLMLRTSRHRTLTLTAGPVGDPSDRGGDVTLRHAGTQLDIFGWAVHGTTAPDRAAVRFAARHIAWDDTDLRFIVP